MPKLVVGSQHIYYEVFGNGPKPILMLPGFLGTIESDFGKLIPFLNMEKFRWICWDPPGYGRSRPIDRLIDIKMFHRCADMAGQFMEELGYDKYYIMGWSQGAMFGMILAGKFPTTVLKLLIWGAFSDSAITPQLNSFYAGLEKLDHWPKEILAEKLKYLEREYILEQIAGMRKFGEDSLRTNTNVFLEIQHAVRCPTLLMYGCLDKVVPEWQFIALKKSLKNLKTYCFSKGGHDLHLKFTEEFVQFMEEFL